MIRLRCGTSSVVAIVAAFVLAWGSMSSLMAQAQLPSAKPPEVWKTDQDLVFLHRGARAVAPESGLASIYAAFEQGADGVEIDLRITADDVVVAFHDPLTRFKAGGILSIGMMSLDEVRELDTGSWFGRSFARAPIPIFEDIVRFCVANDFYLRVEYKDPRAEKFALRILHRYEAQHLVKSVVWSLNDRVKSDPEKDWLGGWEFWWTPASHDLEQTAELLAKSPSPIKICTEDARAISALLGRKPELRRVKSSVRRKRPDNLPNLSAEQLVSLLKRMALSPSEEIPSLVSEGAHNFRNHLLKLRRVDRRTFVRECERWVKDRNPRSPPLRRALAMWGLAHEPATGEWNAMLQKALTSPRSVERFMAAYTIGRLRYASFMGLVSKRLKVESKADVCQALAWCLGRIGDETVSPVLNAGAARWLDAGKDRNAVHYLLAIGRVRGDVDARVFNLGLRSNALETVHASLHGLAMRGGRAAADLLAAGLTRDYPQKKYYQMHYAVAVALQRNGGSFLTHLIEAVLKRPDWTLKRELRFALARYPREGVAAIEKRFGAQTIPEEIAAEAAIGLQISHRRMPGTVAQFLPRLAAHPSPRVRQLFALANPDQSRYDRGQLAAELIAARRKSQKAR